MNADAIPVAQIETDCVIIGAGPVGLFQAFELGLLEIRAHVVDSLTRVGGQCVEFYPDKPIYDIPSVLARTGRELTENLLRQIERFKPTFHLGQEVALVHRRDDVRFDVETSSHTCFITKTISIAGGVGSFQPRKLKVDGIGSFDHRRISDIRAQAGCRRTNATRPMLDAIAGALTRDGKRLATERALAAVRTWTNPHRDKPD